MGAATGKFVDHLGALTERYGKHLYVCFDDDRIPPTTNMLEGFFGRAKHLIRRVTGAGSTSNSVAQNLGPEFLVAFGRFERNDAPNSAASTDPIDLARFDAARARIAATEAPVSRLRSLVRRFRQHLEKLSARWSAPENTS